ncbi:hypothetical protein [Aliivibrio sp. S10_S31]|uniref:hypothetical protein n=1 Tax=Aliivibrio sp. S10_S31 TaxID=2720224 RepID=UPI001680CCC5|nr:hypothetical protein [Aliivibrio sp. S10_S31]MBD1571541.1 hypothetical protein [Aliivibrio sp. S10_S31]
MKHFDEVNIELSQRSSTQENVSSFVLNKSQSSAERRSAFMSAVQHANNRYKAAVQLSNTHTEMNAVHA